MHDFVSLKHFKHLSILGHNCRNPQKKRSNLCSDNGCTFPQKTHSKKHHWRSLGSLNSQFHWKSSYLRLVMKIAIGTWHNLAHWDPLGASRIYRLQTNPVWWFQSLWGILVNWDDYSQYMENTSHVPDHQSESISYLGWILYVQVQINAQDPAVFWHQSSHSRTSVPLWKTLL